MLIWLAPLIVFGLVVFVHELGHFLAAKAVGVYAPRFSIGFGPALFRTRRGETEYRVGVLPLGGYVRMASRLDEAASALEGGGEQRPPDGEPLDPDAMVPFGPKPVPENRWFESKPFRARLVIMLSGVAMNLLLGWAINVALLKRSEPQRTTRVSQVLPGRPAARAGILPGDSIAAIDGRPVTAWDSLVVQVGRSAGTPLRLGLVRDGTLRAVSVTPAPDTAVDTAGKPVVVGRIGVAPPLIGWGQAVVDGTRATGRMAMLVFASLKMIATREAAVSDLSGPVGIAQYSVQAARQGWEVLLYLIALLSVNLAVFNLLPVPILDGGQILVQAVEEVRGRPLTDRAREYVMRIGLAVILLLFITVTFNDLKRLLLGLAGGHGG